MDVFNADIALHVIQYLNVTDSGRLAQSSKRFYYLVHQYRRLRGPELVAAASSTRSESAAATLGLLNSTSSSSSSSCSGRTRRQAQAQRRTPPADRPAKEVYREALQKMQTTPNLVLAFNTLRSTLPESLPSLVPPNTIILGATAPAIQSNVNNHVESTSSANLYLGSMPNAQIKPFCLQTTLQFQADTHNFLQQLQQQQQQQAQQQQQQDASSNDSSEEDSTSSNNDNSNWWKVFLVYACGNVGNDDVESFLQAVQTRYPRATIVGGVCSMGHVSVPTAGVTREQLENMTSYQLVHWSRSLGYPDRLPSGITKQELVDHVYELVQTHPYRLEHTSELDDDNGCIFGVALGGNQVPVRSVVSRGVQSLTTCTPNPSDCLFVHEAAFYKPGAEGYMFQQQQQQQNDNDDDDDDEQQQQLPSYYLIRSILDTTTGKTWTPNELCRTRGHPDYLGLCLQRRRLANADGSSSTAATTTTNTAAAANDGFELHAPHSLSYNINAFLLFMKSLEPSDASSSQSSSESPSPSSSSCALTNAPIDLFDLNGDACIQDLEWTLGELSKTVQKSGEEILGAVMYSCSGRGPTASSLMRGEAMADAKRFAKTFNTTSSVVVQEHDGRESEQQTGTVVSAKGKADRNVPCLGFYAGGEIGPLALARRRRNHHGAGSQDALATSAAIFQEGGVALQGFTVVFALFVVPIFDLSSFPALDDSSDSVRTYFAARQAER